MKCVFFMVPRCDFYKSVGSVDKSLSFCPESEVFCILSVCVCVCGCANRVQCFGT